jgi:DNA repair exonuclease SbcCD nuclease subunit
VTRIAHLADLHIGFSHLSHRDSNGRNIRQLDFERAALLAADRVVAEEPDVCVIAGDLLHETNMYPSALSGAVEFCRTISSAGIPLIGIGGNHDEAEGQGRYNGLRFLQNHAGLELHLDQGERDVGDLRLHLVSFRVLSRAFGGRGDLAPFQWAEDRINVLVSHGYAPGTGVPEIPEGTDTEVPAEWLRDPRFALCLLGHIHHHGEIAERVFFAGSIERRNFGESAQSPGFWIHDLDHSGGVESRSISIADLGDGTLPRPMIDEAIETAGLSVRELDDRVLELFDRHDLTGAMMRVSLENVSTELDRSRSTAAWEKEFKRRGGFHFEASVRTRQVAELLSVEFASAPDDISQGFLDFLGQQDLGEKGPEMVKTAGQVMAEAKDRLIAQESE